jgi:hypothetical protein
MSSDYLYSLVTIISFSKNLLLKTKDFYGRLRPKLAKMSSAGPETVEVGLADSD